MGYCKEVGQEEEWVWNLEASPLFRLSLGSKELFHSNFLEWLWKSYPLETLEAFRPALKIFPTFDLQRPEIEREKQNLDLLVTYKDGVKIVVENKVKSLPYQEQLEGYSNKLSNDDRVNFILLSFSRPDFIPEGCSEVSLPSGATWRWMSYVDYLLNLQQINLPDSYHQDVLADYIRVMWAFSDIVDTFSTDWSPNQPFFVAVPDNVRALRIGDVIEKLRYARLADIVRQKLGSRRPLRDWKSGKAGELFIGSGMTRATGLFDLKYVVADRMDNEGSPAVVGIQIQGKSFRLNFEIEGSGSRALNIAERLKKEEIWFDLNASHCLRAIKEEYPQGEKKFNNFGSSFYYRSKKLPLTTSGPELVEIITKYVDLIREQLPKIETVILDSEQR